MPTHGTFVILTIEGKHYLATIDVDGRVWKVEVTEHIVEEG